MVVQVGNCLPGSLWGLQLDEAVASRTAGHGVLDHANIHDRPECSEEVSQPVAVRYAWADNPLCNLYNEAGLPASPFRTDTWPGVTIENK